MGFTVQLANGHATVNEWHAECETVSGREVGGNLSGTEEEWRAVVLDSAKLLNWLTAERDNHTWSPISARVQAQRNLIQGGHPIDAPVMCSDTDTTDSIRFVDGRHRTVALQQLGATRIPIMVPESQTELFLGYLG